MHKVQLTSNPISSQLFNTYMYRVLALIIAIAMILISNSTLAAVTCDAGFVSDEFAPADYGNLGSNASPPVLGINQLLNGIKNESYIIASNSLNTVATGTLETRGSNFYRPKTLTGGVESFELFQDFTDKAGTRTVSYTFNNKFTEKPQALKNVSLSIYDIDANYARTGIFTGTRYFEFSDQVTITGVTSSGETVNPILKFRGSEITSSTPYRQITDTNSVLCNTDSLDTKCKVSVAFENDDVVKIDVTYGNNPDLEYYGNNNYFNPGDQLINIVFDGYCYKPQPRLTYSKALSTSRKKNTDQFTVQIKDNADNSVVTSGITSVTTTGSNNTVTAGTGTTGTFKVNPTKTYTLTESGSGSTNLADYNALYACRKSDGTSVSTLDPKNLNLTYGDNWTCTITNGSPNYVFSGTVFNDNGGIAAPTKDDVSDKYLNNSLYFNGKYDSPSESGIPFTSGHTITLNRCIGDNGTFTSQTVAINPDGTYSFTVTPAQLGNNTRLCATQNEPSNYIYSMDTTSDVRQINITTNTFTYPDNNFGDVIQDNAALVLEKEQAPNNCNITSLTDASLKYSKSPLSSSGDNPDIRPGQCIAYRITATNRANMPIDNFIMQDALQKKDVNNATVTSVLTNPARATGVFSDTLINGQNGTITTISQTLPKRDKRFFYFNTKYGSTVNAQ
ncbi:MULTISPECIES: hypothetical protein [Psychrobacter]|uniref:hypothetical protein n=1 Tax=Psychrobacter TaxID=497 RepID=UPI000C32CCDB|nr:MULTISPECIES: hypothetical protein [Psychrobacter]PKG36358.1 hypothetical protein CXF65_02625 [Psychrobacter sp. Sarcosine-3u-12]